MVGFQLSLLFLSLYALSTHSTDLQGSCFQLKTKKIGGSSAYTAQLKNPVSICVKIFLQKKSLSLLSNFIIISGEVTLPLTIGSKILFYAQISRLKGYQILSRLLSALFTSTSHKRHGSQFMASTPHSYEEGTAVFQCVPCSTKWECFNMFSLGHDHRSQDVHVQIDRIFMISAKIVLIVIIIETSFIHQDANQEGPSITRTPLANSVRQHLDLQHHHHLHSSGH